MFRELCLSQNWCALSFDSENLLHFSAVLSVTAVTPQGLLDDWGVTICSEKGVMSKSQFRKCPGDLSWDSAGMNWVVFPSSRQTSWETWRLSWEFDPRLSTNPKWCFCRFLIFCWNRLVWKHLKHKLTVFHFPDNSSMPLAPNPCGNIFSFIQKIFD